jgi:hypothetical protein
MKQCYTEIEISIDIGANVPTLDSGLAEKAIINRLRTALKHCETLTDLMQHFKKTNTSFNFSEQHTLKITGYDDEIE